MADDNTIAPVIDAPVADDTTNLPSDPKPTVFEVNADDLQDGKFQGKWDNPQQMADYIKSIEDKHANLTRDIANGNKETDAEIAATASDIQKQQLQEDTIRELAPAFIEGGMVITDEIKAALIETGLTEMEIKVGAYELKESLDKNASYVGGKENYDIIMNHHAETMTPEQKAQFNHSIQDVNNSEALMIGLQVMYEKSLGESTSETTVDRVRGNVVSNKSIEGYASKQELLKDKKYADSRNASASDKAKFRQRLGLTPDNVWRS